ncbi:hypothetical protein [Pseudomonas sp. URIL14HWK12:I5]|uniref:hypothetical protein n=1 Tax=Pseudomonas sp. URIL14HWK12:I5 TaxID=1261630 RepID=UPI0009D85542|nr:hypothetical protein [Pseudomonas sp. URIL14HWK12:I5]SMC70181.1 hypothetical protein SAMN05660385_02094 [Pseudomonas sp. URIL14HWK12:I5]
MIGWLIEVLTYGAIGALIGASWMSHHKDEQAAPCVTHHERQLSPHETQPEPTPALAPGRWIDERYQL